MRLFQTQENSRQEIIMYEKIKFHWHFNVELLLSFYFLILVFSEHLAFSISNIFQNNKTIGSSKVAGSSLGYKSLTGVFWMLLRKWARGVEEEGGNYMQPEHGSQVPSLSVVLKKLEIYPRDQ